MKTKVAALGLALSLLASQALAQANVVYYQNAGGGQTPVSPPNPLPAADANNASYGGVTALTNDGATYTAGRSLAIVCTVAGNVKLTFSDASQITVPVAVGLTVLPFAVTSWTVGGVSGPATATLFNLK